MNLAADPTLLSALPVEMQQWIGVGVVLVIALFAHQLRRRAAAKRRGGVRGGARSGVRGGAPTARSGSGSYAGARFDARPRAGLEQETSSPGQFGSTATRDLTPTEIQDLAPSYAPETDGRPDPGEIVWTWVPYVENDGRGKDRPVLIIARISADSYAGCYLSTKAHRDFVSLGSGGWDSEGRESFLSPERVLWIHQDGMRREGQVLPPDRFERAVQAVVERHRIRR